MELSQSTKNKLRIAEPIILLVAIAVMGYFIYVVAFDVGAECLANPLVYGVTEISEANGENLMCQCEFFGGNLNTIIEVTESGMSHKEPDEVLFRFG